MKDLTIFLSKIYPISSSTALINRPHDGISDSPRGSTSSVFYDQTTITEFDKLIIYCQGIKLKLNGINKAQDLLGKLSFC